MQFSVSTQHFFCAPILAGIREITAFYTVISYAKGECVSLIAFSATKN
jgi:hypothetical protein